VRRDAMTNRFRQALKRLLGPSLTAKARCLVRGKPLPRWGNLRRLSPFSNCYGFDRGTAVDRYYLHRFLERHAESITGRALEIQAPSYVRMFGRGVVEAHSIDIDGSHRPTYHSDLAKADGVVPSDFYDCFVLPNTLSVFKDVEGCLRQALRVVKPGGVILASTGSMTPLVTEYPEYWHFTKAGWEVVLERNWPGCEIVVNAHGNCLVAIAEMLQLSMEELTKDELDHHDPRYPVLVTIFCRKPT
jgi:hypothetical protein